METPNCLRHKTRGLESRVRTRPSTRHTRQRPSHVNAFRSSIEATGRSIWLTILVLCMSLSGCNRRDSESSADDEASSEAHVVVRTTAAQRRVIAQTIDALGRCDSVPENEALLTPAIEGRVTAILVQQGALVMAGQPIIQLDATLAKAELAEKQAARGSLVAALDLLQSLPRKEEQEASRLAVEQAKIAVNRARALVDRLRPLRARNEISEQQMFEAEQALAQAMLQQQTAEAQLEVLVLPPRPQAIAEMKAKIHAAERAVATSQARLDLLTISAPINGVLDRLNCRLGQTIPIGFDVGTILDTQQMLVIAWLPVLSSEHVQVGQPAEIRLGDASSGGEDEAVLKGEVVFKGHLADVQTGNIPVHVHVETSENKLVVGQTVNVSIGIEQSNATLAVPEVAIHDEGEGPAITVVRNGKTVVLQPQFGAAQNGWVAVIGSNLKEGELVVTAGAYNLPNDTPVTTEPADVKRDERE